MRLSGKTALVTGSTSGIGLAIACALAREGANLVLNGFGDHASAVAQVSALGADTMHSAADMRRPEEIGAMMAAAAQRYGGVDIVVNNAGIQHTAPVEAFPVDKWDDILAINLTSAFHTTRLALPSMRERGWGRIVNVASVHGLVASAHKSAYVAAKHGLVGFTKTVALETAGQPITCNAICPGWVLTPLVEKQIEARAAADGIGIDEATQMMLREKQPSGQFVAADELAALVAFLCGDAARQVRGAIWNMDGGWVAQ
ncbi:3-hydroxybutyrate dehydrogenase [Trinickia dabaoshanensis]|uniref:3-hydroxybutyrate dehydrogenase n=1 Tax=Trinickia dabaoshanensis TaxID=564714 RepID=A0A2N7VBT9_9BURK|nr:3-hydroxybutyrate dehydrogenase [Trinickia dabaoshanensis]PMS14554.1 3-hydroxybutyrate dehydrogenase [Trinickia dabaoshanensis]